MLAHHYIEYYARNFPDSPCFTQEGKTSSYADINKMANQLAHGLISLGIKPEHRVAVLGENSIEHLLLFMAAGKVGAVATPLNYRLAASELAFIISDAEVKALIMLDDSLQSTLNELTTQIPSTTQVITKESADKLNWQAWLSSQSEHPPTFEPAENTPYMQLYTSGTTGNPKGVVLSHTNLLALCNMNITASNHRGGPGIADIICAPLFHIGGAGSVIISIYSGAHIILHRSFDPSAVVSDIESYPVNTLFMVPAMIQAVLSLPDIKTRDFSQLKQINYGASPISEPVLRQAIESFGTDFVQLYGMTETAGAVVNLSAADHQRALQDKPGLLLSCGRPSVGAAVRIVNDNGSDAEIDEVGEIWIKSDTNMLLYHNLPEATAESLTNGWIHTGDAGCMDEEGYIYLKDRIKDMVVSGGENIYPVEVEKAISNHEAVKDVAIIGVPDEKFGESLLAFIILESGKSLTLDELIAFCRERIAGYKIPRKMEITDEFPRNASGKVLKKELKKPYWEGVERLIG